MNINLDLYRTFYIVAKNESISRAADILFISQPAVTFQIKKLEEQLEISLFTRTKRGVILTEEGKILFHYIKIAMENISNGENEITNLKNLDSGTIRIGVSTTICKYILMPYLEKFHKNYPKIDIQINNNLSDNLLKELRNGNLDILIMFSPDNDTKDLKLKPIARVQDIFVGNKKYYDLTCGVIKNQDLNSYPLILPKNPSSSRLFLNQYFKENNYNIHPKLEVVSYNLIVDLIRSGFGIGYVTKEFISEELNNHLLYEIKLDKNIPKRTIVLSTIAKKEPNYSAQKLIEMIIKESKISN